MQTANKLGRRCRVLVVTCLALVGAHPALASMYAPVGAYVLADNPTASSYVAVAIYQHNSLDGTTPTTISRLSTGNYDVTLANMGTFAGHVQVSAHGMGPEFCNIRNWRRAGTAMRVRVKC